MRTFKESIFVHTKLSVLSPVQALMSRLPVPRYQNEDFQSSLCPITLRIPSTQPWGPGKENYSKNCY